MGFDSNERISYARIPGLSAMGLVADSGQLVILSTYVVQHQLDKVVPRIEKSLLTLVQRFC